MPLDLFRRLTKTQKVLLGVGGAVGAVGLGAYLLSQQAQATPTQPSGGGGGTTSPCGSQASCTSDADCPVGQICIGGCCGTPIPAAIQVLSNPTGAQDETVGSVFGVCDWGSLEVIYGWTNVTAYFRLVDSAGDPVPHQTVIPHFESHIFRNTSGGVVTDSDGKFAVSYQLVSPYQGSASCPFPGMTVPTVAVDTMDLYLENGSVIGQTVVKMNIYITGV